MPAIKETYVLLVVALNVVCVERLPAPIVESEEKSTPMPQHSETQKQKHSARPKTASEEPPSAKREKPAQPSSAPTLQGPARFAGTWIGKINQGLLGHVRSNVTIDPTATSIALSHNLGGDSKPLTVNGNTAAWKSGAVGEISWTLTPNSDGQTAQVTMKGLLLNDTTTFRRGQPVMASPSPAHR